MPGFYAWMSLARKQTKVAKTEVNSKLLDCPPLTYSNYIHSNMLFSRNQYAKLVLNKPHHLLSNSQDICCAIKEIMFYVTKSERYLRRM